MSILSSEKESKSDQKNPKKRRTLNFASASKGRAKAIIKRHQIARLNPPHKGVGLRRAVHSTSKILPNNL